MKRKIKLILISLLSAALVLCALASCKRSDTNDSDAEDLWSSAAYTESASLGEGERSFVFRVSAEGKTVEFTVRTDKSTVGEALVDCALIEGEQGAYGLYVKRVNGITADFDLNQAYWAFYVNGGYAMSGVDTTEIKDGEIYEFRYEK